MDLFRGTAQFNEKGNVEVDGKEILAKNVLIAVGGKPLIPDIPGMLAMYSIAIQNDILTDCLGCRQGVLHRLGRFL